MYQWFPVIGDSMSPPYPLISDFLMLATTGGLHIRVPVDSNGWDSMSPTSPLSSGFLTLATGGSLHLLLSGVSYDWRQQVDSMFT